MLFRLFTIMAVVALAISTWVLSTPGRTPNRESAAPQAQMPSYYLKTAILTDYDESGIPSVRIAAERIDQIANGPEVALHDVRVDYQPSTGPSWVMTGDLAHVESGGQAVDVTGNVRMLGQSQAGEGPALIRTDTLRYDVARGIASTQSEVHIDFAQQTVSARGLVANMKDRTLLLESRVNGRFRP
jgi:LPS export ABC transporter protein LptC